MCSGAVSLPRHLSSTVSRLSPPLDGNVQVNDLNEAHQEGLPFHI